MSSLHSDPPPGERGPQGAGQSPPLGTSARAVSSNTRFLQVLLLAYVFDGLITVDHEFNSSIGLFADLGFLALLATFWRPQAFARAESRFREVFQQLDAKARGLLFGFSWTQVGLATLSILVIAGGEDQRLLLVPLLWLISVVWPYARAPSGELLGSDNLARSWRLVWILTVALAVLPRLAMMLGAPHVWYSPDSDGYSVVVHRFLFEAGADLTFDPQRTPTTSVYLLGILGTTGSYFAYLILTHALGVLLPLYVAARLRSRLGELGAWLIFAAFALSSRQIHYEHVVGSEAVYVPLMLWAAYRVLLLFDAESTAKGAALSGAAFSLAVLARPQMTPWLLFVVLALVLARINWRSTALFVVLSVAPILGWCYHNSVVHGFFGLTSIGSASLFGAYGHLIDPTTPGHEELKADMASDLHEHNVLYPPWDSHLNWLVYQPDGPAYASPLLEGASPRERFKRLNVLTVEAMKQRPHLVIQRMGYQLWVYGEDQGQFTLPAQSGDWARFPSLLRRSGTSDRLKAALDTPSARLVERVPARLRIASALSHLSNRLNRGLLLEAFEYPIWGFLFAAWAFLYRDRRRLELLVMSSGSLVLIGVTIALGVGWLQRYYLQLLATNALGLALLAGWNWSRETRPALALPDGASEVSEGGAEAPGPGSEASDADSEL